MLIIRIRAHDSATDVYKRLASFATNKGSFINSSCVFTVI